MRGQSRKFEAGPPAWLDGHLGVPVARQTPEVHRVEPALLHRRLMVGQVVDGGLRRFQLLTLMMSV
jgi:hypothetical protein